MTPRTTLVLPLLVAVGACSAPPAAQRGPSVILVSIDTLRPDHLGCYGYDAPTSPQIDAFCDESVVFEHANAQAPSTLPSHASILTSLLPHHHGASWENKRGLPDEITTLAEVLAGRGYRTAAFTGGGQMDPVFGLAQGFEKYRVVATDDFGVTVRRGLEWLDSLGDESFFLFLHSYQVHHPYDPEPEVLDLFETDYDGPLSDTISVEAIRRINQADKKLPAADVQHIVNTYDAEIREVDSAFGRLLDSLRERDLYDPIMLVFTSDHGEELGEHGFVGWHSHTLFEELLRVPLMIRFPAGAEAGRRVERLVRSIDIAPTVLRAIGSRAPEEFSGIDLAALWSSRQVPPMVSVSRLDRADGARVSAIRDQRFKLIRLFSRRQRLFDLDHDPGENWDTSTSFPHEVGRLLASYESLLESRPTPAKTVVNPNDELRRELEALGYIQ
ncbi:MAG: sulfatase [Acidobacteria bacterium]|nr:sulfatase [Acidobacteriota bacterium]